MRRSSTSVESYGVRPRRRVDLSGQPRPRVKRQLARQRLIPVLGIMAVAMLVFIQIRLSLQPLPEPAGQRMSVRTTRPAAAVEEAPVLAPLPTPEPAAEAPVEAEPAAAVEPQPVVAAEPEKLVPVVYLEKGGTLWDIAEERIDGDVATIIAWVRQVKALNGITDYNRMEPGPLVVPPDTPGESLYMETGGTGDMKPLVRTGEDGEGSQR